MLPGRPLDGRFQSREGDVSCEFLQIEKVSEPVEQFTFDFDVFFGASPCLEFGSELLYPPPVWRRSGLEACRTPLLSPATFHASSAEPPH